MVDRLVPTVVRTAAVIRKSGLWDMALIVVAFVLYYMVRGAVVERAGEATSRAIRLVAAIGLWMFFLHRSQFIVFRNAFLISGGIGLILFNLFPTAPPRLLFWGYGLIGTVAAYSPVNYDMQPAAFVNQYAAMPSLHFGWNLLLAIAIICSTKNVLLRTFAVVMPIAMGLAVVVTGNHFILDVVAGTAVALFGFWAAVMLDRHGDRVWNLVVPLSLRRAQA